ncbi:disulfide bond formation protein B [Terrarubrum flagellatum]|uniref:disulfide bond formation protein B n=1 Tax=Terrirubrum flagellatum TaxID=2895980 RepID=UPI003144DF70
MTPAISSLDLGKPRGAALGVAIVAAATISGALIFQSIGYAPCELCLEQRYAYYAGIPLALIAALLASSQPTLARILLFMVTALFLFNAGFGVFHSGVEWGWWPGPAGCSSPGGGATMGQAGSLLQQMQATRAVNCSEAALRILGLSLAGWSAIICAAMAAVAFNAARKG